MKFFKSTPPIRLVVFDLDGTLIDSKKDLANCVNATLRHMGRKPIGEDRIFSYVGRGTSALIAQALGEGISEVEVEQGVDYFLSYYREHKLDHTTLYPGVREALGKLSNGAASAKRVLAVLTNKPIGPSRAILHGLGVASFFRVVYGGNSFESKKPDPAGLCTILEETGVSASSAMMVGDSDVDIVTGVNAGVWTCAITHGFGALNLETNPPDLVVHSLPELADVLA